MSFVSWLAGYIIYIVIAIIPATVAILCYQCGGTSPDDPCITDFDGLSNTSKGLTDLYKQDCTQSKPSWKYCMIETASNDGHYILFHRGCNDGIYFTYNGPRFKDIAPNNESTCEEIKDQNRFVCYRLCDTDYCNGPLPPPCNTTGYGEVCGSQGTYSLTKATFSATVSLVVTLVYFGAL